MWYIVIALSVSLISIAVAIITLIHLRKQRLIRDRVRVEVYEQRLLPVLTQLNELFSESKPQYSVPTGAWAVVKKDGYEELLKAVKHEKSIEVLNTFESRCETYNKLQLGVEQAVNRWLLEKLGPFREEVQVQDEVKVTMKDNVWREIYTAVLGGNGRAPELLQYVREYYLNPLFGRGAQASEGEMADILLIKLGELDSRAHFNMLNHLYHELRSQAKMLLQVVDGSIRLLSR